MSFVIGDDTWRDPVIPVLCTVVGCGWLFIPIRDKCNGTLALYFAPCTLRNGREKEHVLNCVLVHIISHDVHAEHWVDIDLRGSGRRT